MSCRVNVVIHPIHTPVKAGKAIVGTMNWRSFVVKPPIVMICRRSYKIIPPFVVIGPVEVEEMEVETKGDVRIPPNVIIHSNHNNHKLSFETAPEDCTEVLPHKLPHPRFMNMHLILLLRLIIIILLRDSTVAAITDNSLL